MKKQRATKQEKQIKNIYNNILLSLHTMEIHTERQQLLLPTKEMMMMERLEQLLDVRLVQMLGLFVGHDMDHRIPSFGWFVGHGMG